MEPLNRPYRNREEANGESMIPVDRQPDDLRTRIAAVLNSHKADDRYDEWSDCQCGNVGTRWADHLADAVIAALGIYEDEMGTGATRRTRIVSDWEKP